MDKWVCPVCGYIYDPEYGDETQGIPPKTDFKDLPNSWVCPVCGASKNMFKRLQT